MVRQACSWNLVQVLLPETLVAGFDKNKRISAVIVRWEVWSGMGENGAVGVIRAQTVHNMKAHYKLNEFGHIVTFPLRSDRWLAIYALTLQRSETSKFSRSLLP